MSEHASSVSVLEPPTHKPGATAQYGFLAWLRRAGPTGLVVAALLGIGYLGHHTGWSVPKFSALLGNDQAAADDWCAEHAVPESICVECNQTLLPKVKTTWCNIHKVHLCLFEHPELAQVKDKVSVSPKDLDRAQRALDLKARSENERRCKLPERRVQLASLEVVKKLALRVEPAWPGAITETIAASGEIQFAQPSVANVSTPVAGRVYHVADRGQIGSTIERGELLALIDAAEVGKAKSEFLQAYANLDLKSRSLETLRPLAPAGAIPQVRLLEAEAAQREAQIRLMGAQQALVNLGLPINLDAVKSLSPEALARHVQFFGIPVDMAQKLDPRTTSASLYPMLAPRAGVITASRVVAGEVVDATRPLFVVADTRNLWLILNVRNEDVKYLRVRTATHPGQTVLFRPDGSDDDIRGELTWKSTSVDEKTRTVQVRAELPNPHGNLLAYTFGLGRIVLREEKDALLVPSEAVHWEGDCNIVFVQDKNFLEPGAPKVFHVRSVRPGVRQGRDTEIIAGLLPGEIVATQNSASLRAELLKNNLGAG